MVSRTRRDTPRDLDVPPAASVAAGSDRPAHGGGLDAAVARYGGRREDWIDLSTGVNRQGWPVPDLPPECWAELPDSDGDIRLTSAARVAWGLPDDCEIVPAPGVSAVIPWLPTIADSREGVSPQSVTLTEPAYGEYAAAFRGRDWAFARNGDVQIVIHPNNPDGRLAVRSAVVAGHRHLTVLDESFCDTAPEQSLADLADRDGFVVLKGLGKFWGLAGLRLGFAACRSPIANRLRRCLGPWPVSGPAQRIGAMALSDRNWARMTRERLQRDAARLDRILAGSGLRVVGGTRLFRLIRIENAASVQAALARNRIWSRAFADADDRLRLGLPGTEREWNRLETALEGIA